MIITDFISNFLCSPNYILLSIEKSFILNFIGLICARNGVITPLSQLTATACVDTPLQNF